jgi:hypothetical protein
MIALAERVLSGSGRYVSLLRRLVGGLQQLVSLALRFVAIPLLVCVPCWVYVMTVNRYYVRMGRSGGKPGSLRPSDRLAQAAPAE